MDKAAMIARYLLGVIFFVFGLNGFLNFIPVPPMEPGPAVSFMEGMMAVGYFFPVLKGVEVICGLLLLSGFFVPLALIILAPITIQILLYHRFVAGGPPMDIFINLLMLVAAWGYRGTFRPLLQTKTPMTK